MTNERIIFNEVCTHYDALQQKQVPSCPAGLFIILRIRGFVVPADKLLCHTIQRF